MNESTVITLRLGALAITAGLMTGCVAQVAHAVLSPALQSASEASQTRESLGITTSNWRGKSCKDLEFSYNYMRDVQSKVAASGDAHMAKVHGWQIDAIQEVRSGQGCLSANGGAAPPPVAITAYGYCIETTYKHVYLTPMFTYADYFTDSGQAETAAFKAMLASTYGEPGTSAACAMEDSAASAQAAIDRNANLTRLQFRDTVHLNWTPARISKTPAAAPAPQSAPQTSPLAASKTMPRADVRQADGLGLVLEKPGLELIKALGLSEGGGAWVVSVTPDSAAAKAGISPMDVIIDVAGQRVAEPGEVNAITGKMRIGYPASLGVWRDRKEHTLTLTIPAGLRTVPASPATAGATTPASAPAPAAVTPVAQGPREFCYIYLTSDAYEKHPDVLSPVFRDATINVSAQAQIQVLKRFVAKVDARQADVWHDFDYKVERCQTASGVCWASAQPLLGPSQSGMLRCFASQAEADSKRSADALADPGATTVAMP